MNNSYTYVRPKYVANQDEVYKVSRSKIELFLQCPRCFWLEACLGIARPKGPSFRINLAIDELFKKEFDGYRKLQKPHPLMVEYGLDAVPMKHDKLSEWRQNYKGVATLHQPTNLFVYGAIDDIWIDNFGKVIVADYKATAKDSEVNIDSQWQNSYKRQIEIYQWLLRRNGLDVSNTGYFVYTNVVTSNTKFNNKLDFKTKLIPYEGSDDWVENVLKKMKQCLDSDKIPEVGQAAMGGECDYCGYAKQRTSLTLNAMKSLK